MKKTASTVRISILFSGQKINYVVDENLNQLKGKILAPKKLALANEALRKLQPPFPECLNNSKD